jgi:hypothetical protein
MYTVKQRVLKYKGFNGFIAYDVYKNDKLHVSAMSPRLIKQFFKIDV